VLTIPAHVAAIRRLRPRCLFLSVLEPGDELAVEFEIAAALRFEEPADVLGIPVTAGIGVAALSPAPA
jgi:hypothetical protein